jgi:hypothetical protein
VEQIYLEHLMSDITDFIQDEPEYNLAYKDNLGISFKTRCKRSVKNCQLSRNYGISLKEFENMVAKQNGKCLICNKKPQKTLCVDHDHACGDVRGLLCSNCNTGLGLFKENTASLQRAIDYLLEYRKKKLRNKKKPLNS